MNTSPFDIKADLDRAINGQADIDPFEVIAAIVNDVIDSVRLALTEAHVNADTIDSVITTVIDYYDNHYGE